MENCYIKSLTLFMLLFCAMANIVSAKQDIIKTKIELTSEVGEPESFDQNLEFKAELIVDRFFNFSIQQLLNYNADHLKEIIFRFQLPTSHHDLPERPPKK